MTDIDPTTWPNLPPGVQSRVLPINDLNMHFLEAVPDDLNNRKSLVVLLHGFPELA